MARKRKWGPFVPGQVVDLGLSLSSKFDGGASLEGTPRVTVWTRSGNAYTAATGFTIASEAFNTAEMTDSDDNTIAIGRGVKFRLTMGATPATYYVRAECDADNGEEPGTERGLIVKGPPDS